jgi:hypothetical protein
MIEIIYQSFVKNFVVVVVVFNYNYEAFIYPTSGE